MNTNISQESTTLYIAVILYETSSDAQNYTPLYEESFVLLQAASDEEARHKALVHAQQQQTHYHNENNERITWSLKHVVDVHPTLSETLEDGSEIYTRHFRDYQAYRSFEPLLDGDL
jgi:dolichyl-phosphate-mannose--protein O-mannosyl transferase